MTFYLNSVSLYLSMELSRVNDKMACQIWGVLEVTADGHFLASGDQIWQIKNDFLHIYLYIYYQ